MASEDAPALSGPHAVPNADDKRGSAESIDPPERRARLVVTLVCSLILVVVFTMIIYRMINERGNQRPLKSTTALHTPQRSIVQTHHNSPAEPPTTATEKASTTNKTEPVPMDSTSSESGSSPQQETTEPAPQGRSFRRRRSTARELVCVVTEMTTQQDQYPNAYCTHLIYADVVYDPKHRKFLATKNDKSFELFRRNQRSTNMSHLVALNPHQTLNVYLNGLTDIEVQWYFVQMIESLVNDYHFDGVAFIGIELSLDNVQQFSRVIDRLKEALKKKPSRQFFQLVFGGFVTDLDGDPTDIANRIRVIAEEVDVFIIETHYQRPLPLCKTVFPTAFNSYGSFTPNVPINTGLNWLKAMLLPRAPKGRNSICMSLSMVALLFKISGTVDHLQPGNACFEEIWMNYAETCIGHGWSNVKTHPSAMSSFRHKIKFWQSFDTDITVTRKVDLILDQANKTCFAAYYVDYEDYYGMCQGKVAFPRLKAIRELLNKRTNVDEDIDLFGHEF
ncbi:chitinase-3-like protein 1 [Amblyomma americanum]